MVGLEPSAPSDPAIKRLPLAIVFVPVYVLVPVRVTVPAPLKFRLPEPEIFI